jgi:cysteinyl-tRNA synthetase
VAVLFDLASEVNRSHSPQLAGLLRALGGVLGLLQSVPEAFLQAGAGVDEVQIVGRIAERQAAKAARDFSRADAIRAELLVQGIVLKDSAQGTQWEAVAP